MAYLDALGTRIRDRRADLGVKQADLARDVGISASYLNLIEHNRRRIGGKLLHDIAERLEVDPAILSEGAEAALISRLRVAATGTAGAASTTEPEIDRLAEFAGRFPGWAGLLDRLNSRVNGLEAQVENLSGRLAHDVNLSASLHEVLTTAAAIRSTADILAESEDIDQNWRRRFHKNIQDESHRLSDGSQALVSYLDQIGEQPADGVSAQEELERWLSERNYHVHELEQGQSVEQVLATTEFTSKETSTVFRAYLSTYQKDATALPLAPFLAAIGTHGINPMALARQFDADLPMILRRLATVPDEGQRWEIGRVVCDAAGHLTFRKPIPGFLLPGHGAACPLWPLFRALIQPNMPVEMAVEQLGHMSRPIQAYALATTRLIGPTGREVGVEAQMIMVANAGQDQSTGAPAGDVGQSCLTCPRKVCDARREVSIFQT